MYKQRYRNIEKCYVGDMKMTRMEKIKANYKGMDGITVATVASDMGISFAYAKKVLKELEQNGDVVAKMEQGIKKYSFQQESMLFQEQEHKNVGDELQDILLDTIAKYSANKVIDEVMPLVKQKIVDEFGMLPVQHEIKVGTAEPVQIKGNLPPCFDSILAYSTNGNPVMMTGPAGTGKGFLARQVALATGSKFFEVNAVKNSYDLTGFVDANSKFVRTPFYDACKTVADGGKAVFLFDEMDCSEPEVLKIFNEALSSFEFTFPNDEHITFDNLIILCACNTYGTGADEMYCGQQLDASTLDRFVMVRVDYDKNIEMQIANGDDELVEFIDEFRKQTEKNGMMFVASYRSIKRIASMRGILPLWQVMKQCFIKSMADDDLKNILDNMGMRQNTYYRACTGAHVNYPEIRQQKLLIA